MSALDQAEKLHDEFAVLAMRDAPRESWQPFAASVAQFQYENLPGYKALCDAEQCSPPFDSPFDLPAVPVDVFRYRQVCTFDPALAEACFLTSGTTSGARGAHYFRTTRSYRLASMTFARKALLGRFDDLREVTVLAFALQPPESSLGRMLSFFAENCGQNSRFIRPDDHMQLAQSIHDCHGPIALCATSLALVHAMQSALDFSLPRGSIVMPTGGFKAQSQSIDSTQFYGQISVRFACEPRSILSEYGMTEMSSQMYAMGVGAPSEFRYRAPSWLRVRAVDECTLKPVLPGSIGLARFYDLANIESAWAIQTRDRIVVHDDDSIALLGRDIHEIPRGCALAIEEYLGGSPAH
jgi:hypothetical protein